MTILEAKTLFGTIHRDKEGFLGVGIGRNNGFEVIRVYVSNLDSPFAQEIKDQKTFEGYPLSIVVSGEIRAY